MSALHALDLSSWLDRFGDAWLLAIGGFAVGLGFGAFAQRSRFCLRAATVEFSTLHLGPKTAIWVVAFATAVLATQLAIVTGLLNVSSARQIGAHGSLSGAMIGGILFGVGMILARGCASRLLVLSATGNLRAFVSGLILTLVAQASLRGILSPAREALTSLWMIEGGPTRNVLTLLGGGPALGVVLGILWLAVGVWLVRRNTVGAGTAVAAAGVGTMIAAGWVFTYTLSQQSFTPVGVKSVSFTGPSADTLMGLINAPEIPLGFDVGLVPGVFLGSFLAALLAGEWKLEGYHGGASMARYIAGATLMGFGGMLAGGCAVGAGVTGGAIFALTAWIALAAMWAGAIAMTAIDRRLERMAGTPAALPPDAEPVA